MKFGKEFRTHLEETLPDWKDKFLCYKPLKKLLKQHIPAVDEAPDELGRRPNQLPPPLADLEVLFVRILDEELDKLNDFYVDKEEEFIIRLQELKERIERARETSNKPGGTTSSDNEFSEEMMGIRTDFVAIHGEMVLLKNYSSLNFAGLVKILKKYDKRTGGLLRLPFTQLVLDQPFFTTEPLTRLVRECEANLELLFPIQAEVVESNHSNVVPNVSVSSSSTSSLGEGTMDIYRSTVAAIRTIQGLKKASSTSNPLSFGAIFGSNQDNDSMGALTAENSPTDQHKQETDQVDEDDNDDDDDEQ
ncbi:SPX domain-containing protein 4 [Impatiens glandulifera]|uniref:SPX domain-containing protein 4 n=1 Tax=Impatiens glandulifera TaxID=253017 RepID=UPI001FB10441|nr:SPX domain-containing protein 4 [Impatiens glandulifera]